MFCRTGKVAEFDRLGRGRAVMVSFCSLEGGGMDVASGLARLREMEVVVDVPSAGFVGVRNSSTNERLTGAGATTLGRR